MQVSKPKKVKLFIGVMYKDKKLLDQVITILTKKFNEIQDSYEYDFTYTDYYEKEFGTNLKKRILIFKKLIDPSKIVNIKLFTNELENKLSKNNNRLINIDPGYLNKQKLVLASAKERPHRIYLQKGIYADVTYFFNKNNCIVLRNTFPDFRDKNLQEFFIKIKNTCIG
ncbi:MAG: DUF4416 family protein [Candidatus Nanoarchaeia archaeon]|nr:DUF4416 family protein [Candidatus Nanoarchaeia archaeon]